MWCDWLCNCHGIKGKHLKHHKQTQLSYVNQYCKGLIKAGCHFCAASCVSQQKWFSLNISCEITVYFTVHFYLINVNLKEFFDIKYKTKNMASTEPNLEEMITMWMILTLINNSWISLLFTWKPILPWLPILGSLSHTKQTTKGVLESKLAITLILQNIKFIFLTKKRKLRKGNLTHF